MESIDTEKEGADRRASAKDGGLKWDSGGSHTSVGCVPGGAKGSDEGNDKGNEEERQEESDQ